MSLEDNHNHFCIYCGAKLNLNQHFCSQCGHEVYHEGPKEVHVTSKYDEELEGIESEYHLKQSKATQLVEKLFDPTHMAYSKFTTAINKSNQLFSNQLDVTKKMIELDVEGNELVEREIKNKLNTLKTFIDKMEDLINELIIHLSSNKQDNEDIDNLFNDMDDLINSVKNY